MDPPRRQTAGPVRNKRPHATKRLIGITIGNASALPMGSRGLITDLLIYACESSNESSGTCTASPTPTIVAGAM